MIVLACLAALSALYAWLIAPRAGAWTRMTGMLARDYAHRGLHGSVAAQEDKPLAENSLPAYAASAEKGYGIELDVRLTKDNEIVIMHDDDVSRMCGKPGLISQMTLAEVKTLRLMGTGEGVPTLREALSVIAGRVPVIVEMKPCHPSLPARLFDEMRGYPGAYAVESFDPRLVRAYGKLSPKTPRGQLACRRRGTGHAALAYILSRCLLNCISRPDFLAYEWQGDGILAVWLWRKVFRAPTVAWTVGANSAYRAHKTRHTIQIFEKFIPEA